MSNKVKKKSAKFADRRPALGGELKQISIPVTVLLTYKPSKRLISLTRVVELIKEGRLEIKDFIIDEFTYQGKHILVVEEIDNQNKTK